MATSKEYNMKEQLPYGCAKPMYLADVDNKELLKEIVIETCKGLQINKHTKEE